MKRLVLILFFLVFCLPYVAFAMPQIRFPSTIVIPSGMKVHFGSSWVSTSASAMHIQTFYENNWFNYTVDQAGQQQIYNETEPYLVFIDGSQRPITNGWNYAANTVTITGATSTCWIQWVLGSTPTIPSSLPPQSGNLDVLFKVTVGKTPAKQAEIRVYDVAYNELQDTYLTEDNGEAIAHLSAGGYNWVANYRGASLSGSFFHVEAETVTIDFGSGTSSFMPTLDRSQMLKIGVAAIILVGAVLAVSSVWKNKRFR